jgi:hypothetical protein
MSNLEYSNVKEMMQKISIMIGSGKQIFDARIEGRWFVAEIGTVGPSVEGQNYNLRIKTIMPV